MLVMIANLNQIYAQGCGGTDPQTYDEIALPSTSYCGGLGIPIDKVVNTGYDIYWSSGQNKNLHVMVWDGPMGSFSWDFGTVATKGFIRFGNMPQGNLRDPDVVVQRIGANIYAMVVGVVESGGTNSGRIFWGSFIWAANTFTLLNSGFLGSNANGARCENPNIDVNGAGRVALTWHYERTEVITIQTTNPTNYIFPLTPMNVLRSDIFAAYGLVDGTGCSSNGGFISGFTGTGQLGDLISKISGANHLFEKNANPDVCISDVYLTNSNFVITFTWNQSWFNPATFAFENRIMVLQKLISISSNNCPADVTQNIYKSIDFFGSNGSPRIASRPTAGLAISSINKFDFQIVSADFRLGCNAIYNGCNANCEIVTYPSAVYNWGKHNGAEINPGTAINLTAPFGTCDLTNFYNKNAVVSYVNTPLSSGVNAGNYQVTWEHGPDPDNCTVIGIDNTERIDIVSRTYNNGNAIALAPNYSIVNYNFCPSPGPTFQSGNQLIPSTAGRYANNQMGYCFWDNRTPNLFYIGYKASQTGITSGQLTGLKPGNSNNSTNEIIPDAQGEISIAPNPTHTEALFNFDLTESELPIALEVYDMAGKLVSKTSLNKDMSNVTVNTDFAEGVYLANLITNKSTYKLKFTKTK